MMTTYFIWDELHLYYVLIIWMTDVSFQARLSQSIQKLRTLMVILVDEKTI